MHPLDKVHLIGLLEVNHEKLWLQMQQVQLIAILEGDDETVELANFLLLLIHELFTCLRGHLAKQLVDVALHRVLGAVDEPDGGRCHRRLEARGEIYSYSEAARLLDGMAISNLWGQRRTGLGSEVVLRRRLHC